MMTMAGTRQERVDGHPNAQPHAQLRVASPAHPLVSFEHEDSKSLLFAAHQTKPLDKPQSCGSPQGTLGAVPSLAQPRWTRGALWAFSSITGFLY